MASLDFLSSWLPRSTSHEFQIIQAPLYFLHLHISFLLPQHLLSWTLAVQDGHPEENLRQVLCSTHAHTHTQIHIIINKELGRCDTLSMTKRAGPVCMIFVLCWGSYTVIHNEFHFRMDLFKGWHSISLPICVYVVYLHMAEGILSHVQIYVLAVFQSLNSVLSSEDKWQKIQSIKN